MSVILRRDGLEGRQGRHLRGFGTRRPAPPPPQGKRKKKERKGKKEEKEKKKERKKRTMNNVKLLHNIMSYLDRTQSIEKLKQQPLIRLNSKN